MPRIRSALTAIRKQGFALTVGKRNPRVLALAAPVLTPEGGILGSLLMLSPNTPDEQARAIGLVPRLQALAARIGALGEQIRLRQMTVDTSG